jgi:hypothetical protein
MTEIHAVLGIMGLGILILTIGLLSKIIYSKDFRNATIGGIITIIAILIFLLVGCGIGYGLYLLGV